MNGLLAQCVTFSRSSNRWGIRVLDNDDDTPVAVTAWNIEFLSETVATHPDIFVVHVSLLAAADTRGDPNFALCMPTST
jgi:hypothetical protein